MLYTFCFACVLFILNHHYRHHSCLHCLKSMAISEPPLMQAQEFPNHISKDQERAKEVRIVVL